MPRDKVGGEWTWFRIYGPEVRLWAVIQHPQEDEGQSEGAEVSEERPPSGKVLARACPGSHH